VPFCGGGVVLGDVLVDVPDEEPAAPASAEPPSARAASAATAIVTFFRGTFRIGCFLGFVRGEPGFGCHDGRRG
jgi:hypothetical protein